RLELDCSRLGDLGPFALKVDLPRVRRRPRQTAADPPGRVQVALDGVGRSHWTTLRAEDDGRPETAPVASASSRIGDQPLLVDMDGVLLLVDLDAVVVEEPGDDGEHVGRPAVCLRTAGSAGRAEEELVDVRRVAEAGVAAGGDSERGR